MASDTRESTSISDAAPGLLLRLTRGLLGQFASSDTTADRQAPPLDPRLGPWAAKVKTAANAVEQIAGGSHVFVGTACATPRTLVGALETMPCPPADIELVHFINGGAVPHDEQGRATTRFQHRTFFVGSDIRARLSRGWPNTCQCRLRGCRS